MGIQERILTRFSVPPARELFTNRISVVLVWAG
jgi:hypothetical protein